MGSSLSFQMLQEEGGSILHSSHSHYIVSPIEYPKVRHKSNKWRWFCRKMCLILQIPPKPLRLGFQYSLSLNYALSCHECRFEAVGLNTYIFGHLLKTWIISTRNIFDQLNYKLSDSDRLQGFIRLPLAFIWAYEGFAVGRYRRYPLHWN